MKKIKTIEAERALKDGAEIIGEGFVLAVTATTVIFEYNRSAKNTARKAEEKRERIRVNQRKLNAKLNALDIRLNAIEDLVRQQQEIEDQKNLLLLTRVVTVAGKEKPKYKEPPKEQLVPITDHDEDVDTLVAANTATMEEVKRDKETGERVAIESSAVPSEVDNDEQQSPSSWWKFW